jgi:hypothetical protein
MSKGLNIPKSGALDFLSLGALVHRLDPGIIPFRKATHCDIHVSGGEFNVSANLSDCFRLKTAIATAMVNYPIGDFIKLSSMMAFMAQIWRRSIAIAAKACARRWCFTTGATKPRRN